MTINDDHSTDFARRHELKTSFSRAGLTTLAALGLASAAPNAFAQSLVVAQVGDGTAALTNASTAVFLDQFDLSGNQTSTLALPTAASTGVNPYTNSGTATSEATLSLSSDGQYLVLGGYDATTGLTGVASTSTSGATPVLREVAVVTAPTSSNNISSSTLNDTTTTTSFSGNNIRSATTTGGATPYLYADGAATGVVGIQEGGSGAGTVISSTVTNQRDLNIYNGNLYFSTGSGTTRGLYTITGTPTTSGNTATSNVNLGSTASPYGFYITPDGSTLYITDSSAGLEKFTEAASTPFVFNATPVATYAAPNPGTGNAISLYDLAGGIVNGQTTLFATAVTTTGSTYDNSQLLSLTDTGVGSTFTSLATTTANSAFRGVAFIPAAAPEPSGVVAMFVGAGVLGLAAARRRRAA